MTHLLGLFMATTTFDTLKFANPLKAAGVPDKQAEAQASVLGEGLAVNFKELATKDELFAAKGELTAEIDNLELRLNARIDNLEQRLNAKIDNLATKFECQFTLFAFSNEKATPRGQPWKRRERLCGIRFNRDRATA
jgi:hypothetical protein